MHTETEWLVGIAQKNQPEILLPANLELSASLQEAWRQVSGLYHITPIELAEQVAQAHGLALADPKTFDKSVAALLSERKARELKVLPARRDDSAVVFAVSDPSKINEIEPVLKFAVGRQVAFEICPPDELDTYILKHYSENLSDDSFQYKTINLDESRQENKSTIIPLAKALLRTAIEKRASDVHIQPFVGGGIIRYRIDGVLVRIGTITSETLDTLARFYIIQAGGDTTKMMQTQDGRFRLIWQQKEYDTRLSFLPSYGGMRIVARLLDQNKDFSLSNSGFSSNTLQSIHRMLSSASGIILMTGPTGSGKSTTLYAMLSEINDISRNIITIEDPVEYRMPALSQVEVNPEVDLTFADVLRSCLRQDPDVILVGEIRDRETAEIALQAASTGHLVLSTLHTNDTGGTIPRLLGLDVQPTVLADSILGIYSQRLAPKLCPNCREHVSEPMTPSEKLFKQLTRIDPGFRAQGCSECNFTGYHGRLPVVEILEINEPIRHAISTASVDQEWLRHENPSKEKTLGGTASRFIISGETTVNEAVRVVGNRFWADLAFEYKSKLPSSIPIMETSQGKNTAVLLFAHDQDFVQRMTAQLKALAIEVFSCNEAEQASELLHRHEEILFVVVDLPDKSDAEILQYVGHAREALYWSRLPALVLLPPAHPELEQKLIDDGAISKMMTKPCDTQDIIHYISGFMFGDESAGIED